MNSRWIYFAGTAAALLVVYFLYQRFRVAPDIDFSGVQAFTLEGEPVAAGEFGQGKSIICFAASWCGPCRQELTDLSRIAGELSDVNIVVLGDEPVDKLRLFRDAGNFPFPFYKLDKPFSAYSIHTLPTTYLVDKNGVIRKKMTGPVEWLDASTRTHLTALLEQ